MVRNKVYHSNLRQFEAMLSRHFDDANVLSVCNATVGIMGVFYALGLSNAEVITTPFTWQGAFSGLQWLNCRLNFGKIEEPSLTLAPESIVPLISSKTKAVFTADVLGYPCRLDAIKELCKQRNLLLIHDAAGSMGSTYNSFYSGKYADVTIYSFGRNKPFTTNEGGCIVTESDRIFEKLIHSLAHPQRQAIASEPINLFAFNTSLNAFSVEYGLGHFERQLTQIKQHQTMVSATLQPQFIHESYFENALPNFYKPFSKCPDENEETIPLPHFPMVKNFGLDDGIYNRYKILSRLCFPI